jgi:uncharacterized protein (UPF0276 family)
MQKEMLKRPISDSVGIGLRKPYYRQIVDEKPNLGFLEVHSENYFAFGSEVDLLKEMSLIYPISLHGVGLSLGSYEGISDTHLKNLRKLTDIINPVFVSDHVSWSMTGNAHLNDLLPLPYNEESVRVISDNIAKAQDYIGRRMLVENPSSYLSFKDDMPEYEFINKLVKNTSCGVLLDVNNIYVNSQNHDFNPYEYIRNIPTKCIEEIHLAGHSVIDVGNKKVRIDTHDNLVENEVWNLYYYTISEKGVVPTLIEWDQKFPELDVVLGEAEKARKIQLHFVERRDAA